MHKLRFLAALCLILAACTPDDKEKPKQSRLAYKTYEWVEGELVRAEDDIYVNQARLCIEYNDNYGFLGSDYNVIITPSKGGDSIAILPPFFRVAGAIPHCMNEDILKHIQDFSISPFWVNPKSVYKGMKCIHIAVDPDRSYTDGSCHLRPLPIYVIENRAVFREWMAVMNYRTKGKNKCLVIERMDTLCSPPKKQDPKNTHFNEDPIKFDPLDSVYYFL